MIPTGGLGGSAVSPTILSILSFSPAFARRASLRLMIPCETFITFKKPAQIFAFFKNFRPNAWPNFYEMTDLISSDGEHNNTHRTKLNAKTDCVCVIDLCC